MWFDLKKIQAKTSPAVTNKPISKLESGQKSTANAKPLLIELEGLQIEIKAKRRKSLALKLLKQQLVLEVPKELTKEVNQPRLYQLLETHHSWLYRQAEGLQQRLAKQFSGGHQSCFEFAGESWQLLWQPGSEPLITCHQAKTLKLAVQSTEQVKLLLEAWFIEQAADYLTRQLDNFARQMGLNYQSCQIKGYKSRWGSCYHDGRIQFNWRLMQAPLWVVDYVVVHELAHLVHHNHSKLFWQLVEQHYPQMKAAKQQLKQQGPQWIDFLQ